jgi:hypothetical protein
MVPCLVDDGLHQIMKPDPITETRRELLLNLEAHLIENIRGQDTALVRMASVLRRGELGLCSPHRPKGSFLLLGPTGVGKTESTVVFTRYLMGDDCLFRFDMSEYQTQDSLSLLLGADSQERGNLGRCVIGAEKGTLLFDEIEKAHPRIMDVFLQNPRRGPRDVCGRLHGGLEQLLHRLHLEHRIQRTAGLAALQFCDDGAPCSDQRTAMAAS